MSRGARNKVPATIPLKIDPEVDAALKQEAVKRGLVFQSRNTVLRSILGLDVISNERGKG